MYKRHKWNSLSKNVNSLWNFIVYFFTLYNKSKAPVCQKRACDVTEDGHICQRASIVCGSEEDTCDGSANGIRPAIKVEFE